MESFQTGGEVTQAQDMPLQIYLEGHIVIRQGGHELYANQAFYDVKEEKALLLDAEIRTRIARVAGKVRLRAKQLRQTAHDTFHAQQAYITTSDFLNPGYRLQTSDIYIEPRYGDPWNPDNGPQIDPLTGEPTGGEPTLWATSLNNTFFIENVPVFYYPYLSSPAEDPNIPLTNVTFQNDRIFGQAIYTTWDIFKLTGIDRPAGTQWNLNANYLTLRGPQIGTTESYRGVNRWGFDELAVPGVWTCDVHLSTMGLDNWPRPIESPSAAGSARRI